MKSAILALVMGTLAVVVVVVAIITADRGEPTTSTTVPWTGEVSYTDCWPDFGPTP